MDKVEIITLQKRCDERGLKARIKVGTKTPRSRYDLFLRGQLGKITRKDQKICRSIMSEKWKTIND